MKIAPYQELDEPWLQAKIQAESPYRKWDIKSTHTVFSNLYIKQIENTTSVEKTQQDMKKINYYAKEMPLFYNKIQNMTIHVFL